MSAPPAAALRPVIAQLRAYEAEPAEGLVKLDANENPWPPPPGLSARVAQAAAALALNRYPDPAAARLRGLLAARSGHAPEGILLGNGSDELIVLLLAACGAAGARLLVPAPTFSMYRHIALTMGWEVAEVPLTPGFALDERALLAEAAAHPPRLSVFASPNNPTGNLFDAGVMERYLGAAPGLVVIDEAYHDFSGGSVAGLIARHPNLVVLQTLSKMGLAALRVGVLLAEPGLAHELEKVRLPYNLGGFSQAAACAALEDPAPHAEQVRRIVAERSRLAAALSQVPGVTPYPSDANFVLFRTGRPSVEVFGGLRARGVLVRDLGGRPGALHGCLRVTVGTPEENTAFLEALAGTLAGAASGGAGA